MRVFIREYFARFAVLFVLFLASCSGGGSLPDAVSTPQAAPDSRTVAVGTQIALSTDTLGADIYYTLDLSDPSINSARYSAPITITSSQTFLKAVAVKGGSHSGVMYAFYFTGTAPSGTADTPTAVPPGGQVTRGTAITLSSGTGGATIYFTTDGSDPVLSNTRAIYNPATKPIVPSGGVTVKAIAHKDGMSDSGVMTAVYTLISAAFTPDSYPTRCNVLGQVIYDSSWTLSQLQDYGDRLAGIYHGGGLYHLSCIWR